MGSMFLKSILIDIFLPLAIKIIEKYVKSTDTKKDDEILELVKLSLGNIANKNYTNIDEHIVTAVDNCYIKKIQKERF